MFFREKFCDPEVLHSSVYPDNRAEFSPVARRAERDARRFLRYQASPGIAVLSRFLRDGGRMAAQHDRIPAPGMFEQYDTRVWPCRFQP